MDVATVVPVTPVAAPAAKVPLRDDVAAALRRLAVVVLAGGVLGLLVGGVGGRLAMMLLAVLNDDRTGLISDDGFRIGQLTASGTVNLLTVGTLLGVFGGPIYLLLRPLLIGPRWFQIGSIATGPAVVVGAMLVHVDGVDFTLLRPAWLAIALFVAIPGLYAGLLTVVAERWLAAEDTASRVPRWLRYVPLLLLAPVFPLLVPIVGIGAVAIGVRRVDGGRATLAHPALLWAGRGLLTVIFCVAVVDLARDAARLT